MILPNLMLSLVGGLHTPTGYEGLLSGSCTSRGDVSVHRCAYQKSLRGTRRRGMHAGDVGVGLNVRRLRDQFLAQFITTYSIMPIGDIGTIFRKYPELWKVFIQDELTPGRFRQVAERPERPAGVPELPFSLNHACLFGWVCLHVMAARFGAERCGGCR
jgi:hypothetical protein